MVQPLFIKIKDGIYVNVNHIQSIILVPTLDRYYWVFELSNKSEYYSKPFYTEKDAYKWLEKFFSKINKGA